LTFSDTHLTTDHSTSLIKIVAFRTVDSHTQIHATTTEAMAEHPFVLPWHPAVRKSLILEATQNADAALSDSKQNNVSTCFETAAACIDTDITQRIKTSAEVSSTKDAPDTMSVDKAGQGVDVMTASDAMQSAKRSRLVGPAQAIDNNESAGGEMDKVCSRSCFMIDDMR
jgi:hypothetical protein